MFPALRGSDAITRQCEALFLDLERARHNVRRDGVSEVLDTRRFAALAFLGCRVSPRIDLATQPLGFATRSLRGPLRPFTDGGAFLARSIRWFRKKLFVPAS
jgi:hypothetical protein